MITPFDTNKHHIHIDFIVTNIQKNTKHNFDGILDCGAPRTEFADIVLCQIGLINAPKNEIKIKEGLQTQKYDKVVIPSIEICGQTIENYEVMVSRFDESWGAAALIGLDFFRKFRVTVDYKNGQIITEQFS